jgi:hypothetical protein
MTPCTAPANAGPRFIGYGSPTIAKADDRPIFAVSFRAEKDIDGERAFKALLKFALKKYGLRVVTQGSAIEGRRVTGH